MKKMPLTPDDLLKPTISTQCVFAIALPMSQEQFFADIADNSDKDYVKGIVKSSKEEEEWEKWEVYRPVISKMQNVIELAEKVGMKVLKRTNLKDLSECFANYQIITLLAHWRGPELKHTDIKTEPVRIAEHILESNDDVSNSIRKHIELDHIKYISESSNNTNQKIQIANLINKIIYSNDPILPIPQYYKLTTLVLNDSWLAFQNRNTIDNWLPEAFKPGNRLELTDGLYSIDTIKNLIPSSFSGIIDFAICQSELLADYIKSGYPKRRVIMGNSLIHPIGRLIIQEELIKRLDKDGGNYAIILSQIVKDIIKIRSTILKKGILNKIFKL
jgi:hypothetical protein